jgi:hypothetical protein
MVIATKLVAECGRCHRLRSAMFFFRVRSYQIFISQWLWAWMKAAVFLKFYFIPHNHPPFGREDGRWVSQSLSPTWALGKFRTRMKTIAITSTSSFCGYRASKSWRHLRSFRHFRTFQTNIILFIFFDLWTCSPWKYNKIWLFEFFGIAIYAYCPWVYAW